MSFDAQLLLDEVLLDAVTTGTGTALYLGGGKQVKCYVSASGTVSAGKIIVEESSVEAGPYSTIGSEQTLVTDTQTTISAVTGPYKWIRGRVSTNVTGGATATVRVCAV